MSIGEEIDQALECMDFEMETAGHDNDECFWCGFDTEDGQVPDLLRRAKVALVAQAEALTELRAMKERATHLLTALTLVPPTNAFDQAVQAAARYIRDNRAEVGTALASFIAGLKAGKVEAAPKPARYILTLTDANGGNPEVSETTLSAFLADNEDSFDGETIAALRGLNVGESYRDGGGAAPIWEIRREQ